MQVTVMFGQQLKKTSYNYSVIMGIGFGLKITKARDEYLDIIEVDINSLILPVDVIAVARVEMREE